MQLLDILERKRHRQLTGDELYQLKIIYGHNLNVEEEQKLTEYLAGVYEMASDDYYIDLECCDNPMLVENLESDMDIGYYITVRLDQGYDIPFSLISKEALPAAMHELCACVDRRIYDADSPKDIANALFLFVKAMLPDGKVIFDYMFEGDRRAQLNNIYTGLDLFKFIVDEYCSQNTHTYEFFAAKVVGNKLFISWKTNSEKRIEEYVDIPKYEELKAYKVR